MTVSARRLIRTVLRKGFRFVGGSRDKGPVSYAGEMTLDRRRAKRVTARALPQEAHRCGVVILSPSNCLL